MAKASAGTLPVHNVPDHIMVCPINMCTIACTQLYILINYIFMIYYFETFRFRSLKLVKKKMYDYLININILRILVYNNARKFYNYKQFK